ncbi:MAG: DegT/DnrJ/EryC1/StrS family aminotransferase, partial [Longimicrobiales bacterium]
MPAIDAKRTSAEETATATARAHSIARAAARRLPARIELSSPHMGGLEEFLVADAFATNWIAPLGPHVDAFEREFAEQVGCRHAVALS